MTNDTQAVLDHLCELSREAGRRIMQFYRSAAPVIMKEDTSPLTAADSASHHFLTTALAGRYPDIPIVSEESADANSDQVAQCARYWLVDPLDGTKEFIKATDEFTVNVALIEAGRPTLGVVHAPALSLTYYAGSSLGAWKRQGDSAATSIKSRQAAPESLTVVASKDHAGPMVKSMVARLPGAQLQSMGSSLKFCLVAEGMADLYLRDLPTMEWDTAAAHCVVESAGGAIYEIGGLPLRYGKAGLRNGAIMTVGDLKFPWKNFINSQDATAAKAVAHEAH